ncbi:hypothetical protein [Stappia stellulata]|uniref:hypothetical protein n=1 Tax=Stappia stellulata TaxID=71235 RepID=UPI000403CDAE|nr:hypothetical protein [Stappia stellulata]
MIAAILDTLGLAARTMAKDPEVALVYRIFGPDGRDETDDLRNRLRTALRNLEIAPGAGQLRVCAEGDSWINILWPWSSAFGYEKTFFDVIEGDSAYYTRSVGYPGDTLADMLAARDYRQLLASGTFDCFIFSGGGNDVLGGAALSRLLRDRPATGAAATPAGCIDPAALAAAVSDLAKGYDFIARDVTAADPDVKMLVHGYDYPRPVAGEPWLGVPFAARGYDLVADKDLIEAILMHLVDAFYDMLATIAASHAHVEVVDLRTIVAGRWNDELHPKETASLDLAAEFTRRMPTAPVA